MMETGIECGSEDMRSPAAVPPISETLAHQATLSKFLHQKKFISPMIYQPGQALSCLRIFFCWEHE